MHRIRDGRAPAAPAPERSVEAVIVGGGIAGLTAAYHLKDVDFLLLEREEELGGNARGGQFRGIRYSQASAYVGDVFEPYGPFYEELGLKLTPLLPPADQVLTEHGFAPVEGSALAADFAGLKRRMTAMEDTPAYPDIPVEEVGPEALKLDAVPFKEFLAGKVAQPMLEFLDAYCYAALGGGVDQVSAYAGLNFYSEVLYPLHAFAGGNNAVTEALVGKLGRERLVTGASVFRVEQRDDRVLVSYFAGEEPPRTVEARAAVLAVPYFFVPRLLAGVPEAQARTLRSFTYGAYLVANCCFNSRVFRGAYDNWLPGGNPIVDFVIADYAATGGRLPAEGPQVLTCYRPYRNPAAGRAALLAEDPRTAAEEVEAALRSVVGYPLSALEEIRLSRFGHQILTSRPGLVETARGLEKRLGRVVLIHSDGQAMGCIEAAITEATRHVPIVKKLLASSA